MAALERAKNAFWFAVRTKSRQEKIANRLIAEKGITTFLPLQEETHQWSDRKKNVLMPLFPGYLFVHCIPDDLRQVFHTKGVAHLVGGKDGATPIPDRQILSVKKLLESDVPFDAHPYIQEGTEIEVKRGPLKGCYGRVVRKKGKARLVVTVDLIARAVCAEVDLYDVKAL